MNNPPKLNTHARRIRLPNGYSVSIASYVAAWQRLKTTAPDTECKGWDMHTVAASEVLRQMREGIDDRINLHVPGYGRGRKWDPDWQRATLCAARDVNTPFLAVHWLPIWLRDRLAHRLSKREAA